MPTQVHAGLRLCDTPPTGRRGRQGEHPIKGSISTIQKQATERLAIFCKSLRTFGLVSFVDRGRVWFVAFAGSAVYGTVSVAVARTDPATRACQGWSVDARTVAFGDKVRQHAYVAVDLSNGTQSS